MVIKYNSNQRYATNSSTAFVIKEIARRRNIPIQEVMVRNDTACGSTIGPIVASGLGIRTVGEFLEIARKKKKRKNAKNANDVFFSSRSWHLSVEHALHPRDGRS